MNIPGQKEGERDMDWKLDVVPVGPLQMNAVIVTATGPDGPETILVDPGDEPERLLRLVEETGGELTHLLATHGHFDHVGAGAAVQGKTGHDLRCHPGDLPMISMMQEIQGSYGFPATDIPECRADLEDGATIPFAGGDIEVRHVPGHSPGQVMFVLPQPSADRPGCAIVGDCVFAGSVGRTDLPGGDFPTLEKSIRERIYTLPDDTILICGHGPDTTVGREKATNPFVRG